MGLYRKYSYLWITALALYFFYRAGSSGEYSVLHIVLGVSQLVIACRAYEQSIDRTKIPTDSWLLKVLKRFPVKTALTLFSVFLMASLMFLMTYCFERCVVSDNRLAEASVVEAQAAR